MNIKQAKEYIRQTVLLYLKKDEFGEYRIPVVRQRPVFLLGAPGVGKTAIMEQIAAELGIALVSYSMTHHTRQSALGLPFIEHKNYDGIQTDVSSYTMSEIIASVYDTMESSGKKEGILFLDEINCVSETLSPSMLQFLQYKIFGRHAVPEGWVVVTAGNPPEYNKAVREFDVVTMDRLKVLDVTPDYGAWREYALDKGLHSAVLSFLELKKEYFYKIETTAKGRSYVTARGWEDLSQILEMYEEEGLKVDETLIGQYLRNDKIVREFGAYYDLYNKYKRDYGIEEILAGKAGELAVSRARKAGFDEKLSLLSMLIDNLTADMRDVMEKSDYLADLTGAMKHAKSLSGEENASKEIADYFASQENSHQGMLTSLQNANAMSSQERRKQKRIITFLQEGQRLALSDSDRAYDNVKGCFDERVNEIKEKTAKTSVALKAVFDFVAAAFEDGNEMLILVSALTSGSYSSGFIGRFGSSEYAKYSKELMVGDVMSDIGSEIELLDL